MTATPTPLQDPHGHPQPTPPNRRARAVMPLAASLIRFGNTRTSGAPSSRPGLGRIWVPSARGNTRSIRCTAKTATSRTSSSCCPETFISMDREPPMPRPNSERWVIAPNVPGSK